MGLIIREATPADAITIRDFQVAMALESEKMRLDPDTCLGGVRAVFEDRARGHYWIAEKKGTPVACVYLQKEWSDWRCRTVLWIHSLYVVPTSRGEGIYRAIYGKLQERVKYDPELGGLRLYVDKTNALAICVYERLGMTRNHYHLYEWLP